MLHTIQKATRSATFSGAGLDECNIDNAKYTGEREVAAAGFRKARRANPDRIIAGDNSVPKAFEHAPYQNPPSRAPSRPVPVTSLEAAPC